MGEEFFESDILFSDSDYDSDTNQHIDTMSNNRTTASRKVLGSSSSNSNITASMNIPTENFSCSASGESSSPSSERAFQRRSDLFIVDGWLDDDGEDEMMIPPHLIVSKRISMENTRPCSAALKGRNLYRVRNSILRMTGFLEQ